MLTFKTIFICHMYLKHSHYHDTILIYILLLHSAWCCVMYSLFYFILFVIYVIVEKISKNQSISPGVWISIQKQSNSSHPPQAITSFWIVVVAYWAPLYSQASKIYIIIYTPLCIYNLSSHLIVGVVDCCMPIKILLSYPWCHQ